MSFDPKTLTKDIPADMHQEAAHTQLDEMLALVKAGDADATSNMTMSVATSLAMTLHGRLIEVATEEGPLHKMIMALGSLSDVAIAAAFIGYAASISKEMVRRAKDKGPSELHTAIRRALDLARTASLIAPTVADDFLAALDAIKKPGEAERGLRGESIKTSVGTLHIFNRPDTAAP